MDNNHLTDKQSDTMWYHNREASVEDAKDEPTETRVLHQPWRSYWPPKCEKIIEMWLHSEYPEVMSWRFDPHRPFDRPWRNWTRSARASEERAAGLPYGPTRGRTG
jgi:hypothetical protein